jgi:hypothetical protein
MDLDHQIDFVAVANRFEARDNDINANHVNLVSGMMNEFFQGDFAAYALRLQVAFPSTAHIWHGSFSDAVQPYIGYSDGLLKNAGEKFQPSLKQFLATFGSANNTGA